jgi:hypothetical protein
MIPLILVLIAAITIALCAIQDFAEKNFWFQTDK